MQALGHRLNAEEQELLDADEPSAKDIISFLGAINRHHYQSDNVILCLCISGRRSLHAVEILRSINYDRCFSVAGGVRAWRNKFRALLLSQLCRLEQKLHLHGLVRKLNATPLRVVEQSGG